MFIDSHCHIYSEYYSDIKNIINNAKKNNIIKFINNGCDTKTSKEVIKLSNEYENIYAAIGIHPENVSNYSDKDLSFIKDNLSNPKVIAIGEIGLDYHYTKDNKDKQIELFEKQLKIAEKYNLPVIIHSREATEDTLNTLKKYKVKGVIHSFSGSLETAKEYIKMGYLLGINGVVTFKNCKTKDFLTKISLNNIILETDSPYLTPEPFRGKKNEPGNVIYIAKFVADLYGISLEELSKFTNNNIRSFFDI